MEMVGLSVDGEDFGLDLVLFWYDVIINIGGVIFDFGMIYIYLVMFVYDVIFERISNFILNYIIELFDLFNGGYCIFRDGLNIDRSMCVFVWVVFFVMFYFVDVVVGIVVDYVLELDNFYMFYMIGYDDFVVCLVFFLDNSGVNMVIGSIV